jgi:hypothetical protein
VPSSQTYQSGGNPGGASGQRNTISEPFILNGIKYRTETVATLKDGKVISSEVRIQKAVEGRGSTPDYPDTAVTRDGGKTWFTPGSGRGTNENQPITTSNTNLTAEEISSIKPGGSLNKAVVGSVRAALPKQGATPVQTEAALNNTPQQQEESPNASGIKKEDLTALDEESKKEAIARKKYNEASTNIRYPENLQLEHQDCIKFTIFNYEARGLSFTENYDRRRLKNKTPIGTIFLPIPGGISDSNSADWQRDDLDLATQGISDFITSFVSGGVEAGTASAQNTIGAINATDKKTLASIVAVKTNQAVTGTNVLSRAYGQVLNPNSELLFTGPQLRSFSFSFRLSPRSASEAKIVRTIIRYFKQAMSVQRSQSILLLKAPNTFGIEYLTAGKKKHPYLNTFKECALTQCNVNYTPDGQYMTYAGEPSMTSYELQLQFQELEPIFNDDYTDLDKDQDNFIGY